MKPAESVMFRLYFAADVLIIEVFYWCDAGNETKWEWHWMYCVVLKRNSKTKMHSCVGSNRFRFWRKTDEMTKTGRRNESIDFWWNWQNSGFVAKFLTKFALFDERKMAFLVAKSFGAYSCVICTAHFALLGFYTLTFFLYLTQCAIVAGNCWWCCCVFWANMFAVLDWMFRMQVMTCLTWESFCRHCHTSSLMRSGAASITNVHPPYYVLMKSKMM